MSNNVLTVCLDNIIFHLQKTGGISRYWYELTRRAVADDLSLCCIRHPAHHHNTFGDALAIDPASIRRQGSLPLRIARYLPVRAGMKQCSVFHSSYYRTPGARIPSVVTVHDFTYERFRTGFPRRVHSFQKHAAVKAANVIICISENTRKDISTFMPDIDQSRIRVIPLGVGDEFSPGAPRPDILAHAPFSAMPYALFVGVRGGYKDFHTAVEAVASLPGLALVAVGGGEMTAGESALVSTLLPGRFMHLPPVEPGTLNGLYSNAYCLVYPSRYEGFGLPVLEAMKAGCPVVGRNASSIPEVAGGAAILFDGDHADAAQAMESLSEETHRARLVQNGIEHANQFTWDACYEQTRNAWRDAAGQACA